MPTLSDRAYLSCPQRSVGGDDLAGDRKVVVGVRHMGGVQQQVQLRFDPILVGDRGANCCRYRLL